MLRIGIDDYSREFDLVSLVLLVLSVARASSTDDNARFAAAASNLAQDSVPRGQAKRPYNVTSLLCRRNALRGLEMEAGAPIPPQDIPQEILNMHIRVGDIDSYPTSLYQNAQERISWLRYFSSQSGQRTSATREFPLSRLCRTSLAFVSKLNLN